MLPADAHPAFAPHARRLARLPGGELPDLALLNAWAREAVLALPDGRPLAFVAPPRAAPGALDYERRVAARAEIVTRPGSAHDALNALAWLAFPHTKAALNALHVAAGAATTANVRDRRRDAATLLDESGLIVACTDAPLVAHWRAHAWREAFGGEHLPLAAVVLGHGLLEKLRRPYRSIIGRALVLAVDPAALPRPPEARAAALDVAAAAWLRARVAALAPEALPPLPLVALPDWDLERQGGQRFDDVSVFRPPVLR